MPTSTTNYALVKPAGPEDADISVVNSNMDLVDTAMKSIDDNNLSVAPSLIGKRVHRKDVTLGATDASGFITTTHGAPFTPTMVQVINQAPASSFAAHWGSDTYTVTNVRLRFFNASAGGALNALAVGAVTIISWE